MTKIPNDVRNAYRRAAVEVLGASRKEAETYIVNPQDDPGEWAPDALAIIYLEPTGHDKGVIPDQLSFWSSTGIDRGIDLGDAAGAGRIEYINAAVAAVW